MGERAALGLGERLARGLLDQRQHRQFVRHLVALLDAAEPRTLVSDRTGVATAYAIASMQERGTIFIEPTTQVYEGMLIGENSRTNDLDVNICREKKQTNMRSSGADDAIRLVPPHLMGLEVAVEFINDDELVEVTPKSIRLRKRILQQNMRPRKSDD